MDKITRLIGPVSGILFVVGFVLGAGISGDVDAEPTDSASTVVAEFREISDDILLGRLFTVLGIGFLLVFVGHLRAKFRDGGAGWAADGFLAGGVALAGAMIVFVGVELAGAEAADRGHAEVAQGAVDFLWNGTLLFSPGLLAVGITGAIASFVHRILPIWLGALAVVVALGAFAPWVGIVVFGLWVVAAGVVEVAQAVRNPATADAT
ncbi:MAG: hypothetical protein ACR2P0_17700 [Acidimicrobiales bacterium]